MLFTDLVGSTALSTSVSASQAEEMRLAHFAYLRDAVEAHGGREVKNLGDGIMAVFPGASAALDAGVAMQQAVTRHSAGSEGPEMSIRVGVATGDCTEEDGDYFGEPVIQAARLCAAATGGQILATQVIGYLVPRDAHDLESVGELELKGLPEPVPALQLKWTPAEEDSPGLAVPLPTRLAVQTGLVPLVGRRAEREAMRDALKVASAGERGVILITGEAGLGKTRLAAEFASDAFETGVTVLYGRCDEELSVPYLPWVEALSPLVELADEELIADLDPAMRAQLGRLLPRLRDGASYDSDEGRSGDQYALFGAVTELLSRACAETTVVLVLDDLHWADRSSLQLLHQVTTARPRARLLIVGTYRETDLAADDPLTETSARLHRETGVHRITLSGLSDDEVVELVTGAAGHALDESGVSLAHVLRTDTAGNPFFVTEVLRHLVETGAVAQHDGRWSVARDLDDIELPQSVRDVVGQRVRRLSPEARTVLTAAAVVGREFVTPVVAGATGLTEDDVLDTLEEAMAAGLVAEVPGAVDRFTFTHALVQHTLYGELSESRRARMHRRVAVSIEETVGGEPGELAQHWFAAVRPAELDKAVSYALAAGERALEMAAPDEAVRWLGLAFESLDGGDPELRCEVQVRLGDAERQAGRPGYRERLLDAARQAQELHRADLLVAAALDNYRGWHSASGEVDVERVAVIETAAASSEVGAADRARLLATLAGELTYTGDPRRFELARQAEELGTSTGDRTVLLDALERVASALNVPEMLAERRRRTALMMELTEGGSDPLRRFLALEQRIDVYLTDSDMDGARRCAVERRAIADTLGQPTFQWLAVNGEALLDLVEGDIDAAQAGADRSFELGLESAQPDLMVYFGGMLMQIHLHRGQFAEIVPLVRERAEAVPGLSAFRPVLVNFLCHAGETGEASALLADMAAQGFAFTRDIVWLTSMAMCAEAAGMVGDTDSARKLYDELLPYEHQVITTRAHCIGPVGYYIGKAAVALELPAAADHFRGAITRCVSLRSPFHKARAMLALAELLRAEQPSGSAELVEEAAELAGRYAMTRLAEQARALGA